ncbi:unnamed protein product [Clavelina lepadiformis]|uniref:CUB domain-containing protein n=1 Tax=Clavelina lepadiformis TaxID=159417 RepID=A0ABP0F2A2_CLALP
MSRILMPLKSTALAFVLYVEAFRGILSSSANSVPENYGYISTESVGSYANPNLTWTGNVPNITLRFKLDFQNAITGSIAPAVKVQMKTFTATLALKYCMCDVQPNRTKFNRYLLSCSKLKIDNRSCSHFEVNLTIRNPEIELDNTSVVFNISSPSSSTWQTKISRPVFIKNCPLEFNNKKVTHSRPTPTSKFRFQEKIPVECIEGVMFYGNDSYFKGLAFPPVYQTCGPYARFDGPELACWQGQKVNLSQAATHVRLRDSPAVFLCYNENPSFVSTVTLHVGHHKSVDHSTIAWINVSLPWQHDVHIHSSCTQHFLNGTTSQKNVWIEILNHSPRIASQVMTFHIQEGSFEFIRIPFTVFPPINRSNVHITKAGKTFTSFILERRHKNIEIVIMKFESVKATDFGNYTIEINDPMYDASVKAEVLLVRHSSTPGSVVGGIVAGSVIFVLILLGSTLFVMFKRKRLLYSSTSDGSIEHLSPAPTSYNDDVFLPDGNNHEYEMVDTSKAETQTTSFTNAMATMAPEDEEGYMTPAQLGVGHNYLAVDDDEKLEKISNNTDVSYVNTLDADESHYVNLSFQFQQT